MKLLVETTSNIFLLDPVTGCEIDENRPSVVKPSSFVDRYVVKGDVRVLEGELPDSASDAEFAEFWAADPKVAVEAYVAKMAENTPDDEPEQVKRPRKSSNKTADAE